MRLAEDYLQFVRDRITELIELKNISEYELSYALGKNKGYINKITSGKSSPSMLEFFNICDYFNIDPSYFFNSNINDPAIINDTIDKLKKLNSKDLLLVRQNIDRLLEK